MLTPQDIKDKKFEKALVGGYEMALVDDFLERLSQDYTTLYKESAVLKSKLKVLVEKVEEYRSTEDSMRMALLTAQKMGHEIVEEAKEKSDAILAEVSEQAQRQSAEYKQKLAMEDARLLEAQRKTSSFSRQILDLIAEEKLFMERLETLQIQVPVAPSGRTEVPTSAPVAPELRVVQPVLTKEAAVRDEVDEPVKPYLASEPKRPSETASLDEGSPFVEDAVASGGLIVEAELKGPSTPEEVDYFKMFDQDHMETVFEQEQPEKSKTNAPLEPPVMTDARAAEKADIARSISASLGDTKDLKVDVDAFWDDESQPTTKRPKFDFEDLQFGTNLQEGSE